MVWGIFGPCIPQGTHLVGMLPLRGSICRGRDAVVPGRRDGDGEYCVGCSVGCRSVYREG